MADVRIYKPAKNAMQSGTRARPWRLEFVKRAGKSIDPLMGWVSGHDMTQQIKLDFATVDEAVSYAMREGLSYRVIEPKSRRLIIKNYADNFKFVE